MIEGERSEEDRREDRGPRRTDARTDAISVADARRVHKAEPTDAFDKSASNFINCQTSTSERTREQHESVWTPGRKLSLLHSRVRVPYKYNIKRLYAKTVVRVAVEVRQAM